MDNNFLELINIVAGVQEIHQAQVEILNNLHSNIDSSIRSLYTRQKFDDFLSKTYIFDAKNSPFIVKEILSAVAAQKFLYNFIHEFKQTGIDTKNNFINGIEKYLEVTQAENLSMIDSIPYQDSNNLSEENIMQVVKDTISNFDAYDNLYSNASNIILNHSAEIKEWFNQHVFLVKLPNGESDFSINF